MRILLVALLLPLAGCLDSGGDAQEEDAKTPTDAMLTMTACHEVAGIFDVPEAVLGWELPEGFSFQTEDGLATFVVFVYGCDLAEGNTTDLWAMYYIDVPDAYHTDNVTNFFLARGWSNNAGIAGTFEGWGLTKMTFTEHTYLAPSSLGVVQAGGEDERIEYDLFVTLATAGSLDGGQARVFGIDEGVLTGIVDASWTEAPASFGEANFEQGPPGPIVSTIHPGLGSYRQSDDYTITFWPGPSI